MVRHRKTLKRRHNKKHFSTRSRSRSLAGGHSRKRRTSRRRRSLKGGNQPSPYPWNVNTGGQYYVNNNTGGSVGGVDPAISTTSQQGGKRYRRKQRGGALSWSDFVPSDVLNLGRSGMNGLSNTYNGFMGSDKSQSPLPTSQKALMTPYEPSRIYADYPKIVNDSRAIVASV